MNFRVYSPINFLLYIISYIALAMLLQSNTESPFPFSHFFSYGAAAHRGLWPPHSRSFSRSHTRRATVGRTPLGK
jgi:hypothetical protein